MERDNEDFTMVFNETYAGLCRFLECLLGGHTGLAQELAQESFLRLYKLGNDAPPAREARFWLYRVARNLALNEMSKTRTRSRLLSAVAQVFKRQTPGPEENLERHERRSVLLTLLNSLPEGQRAALLLREQEEMSYREIARILNITESKVKTDIFRARTQLRARWNERKEMMNAE
jgi:RNA polymerase sigma factor (sigma-70 family)